MDKIVDSEKIIRDEIQVSDVDRIVEDLLNGKCGGGIDMLDRDFGAKRKAIVRAMARAIKNPGDSASVDMIDAELRKLNYIDNETAEAVQTISRKDITDNLDILNQMDFIEIDIRKQKEYRFTAELYRLLMLPDRKIDKFVMINGGYMND